MLQLLKMNHPDYKVIHNEYVISVVNSVRKKILKTSFVLTHID